MKKHQKKQYSTELDEVESVRSVSHVRYDVHGEPTYFEVPNSMVTMTEKDDTDKSNIIDSASEYIKVLFAGNSDGHGFDHSMRVYRNAMMIAEAVPAADRTIVALGALLHDADDHKLFQTEDNANARHFLEAEGINTETTDRIVEAINSVSFSRNGDRRPESIEGQIIQDADRLDAIGAIGIARTFAFGGKHKRSLESSVEHFHEKLLLLKDRMNTDKAKELAEDRHAFMEAFLKDWQREAQGSKSV